MRFLDLTPAALVAPIAAATAALAQYVSAPDMTTSEAAEEVVRNAAQAVLAGEPIFTTLEEMLAHRVDQGWITCRSISDAAYEAAMAWDAAATKAA